MRFAAEIFAPARPKCYNSKKTPEVHDGRTHAVCPLPGQAGCREKFVRQLVEEGILTLIRQEDGCLAYDYYFSAQDENELLLIERWQSAEHQRVHMQQPHMARLKAIKEQNVDSTTLGKVRLEA